MFQTESNPKESDTANVRWSWSGCSDNVRYGMEFTRQFLQEHNPPTAGESTDATVERQVRLHNADVGRQVGEKQEEK